MKTRSVALALLVMTLPIAAEGQTTMHQVAAFDPSRAILSDEPMFDPFYVDDMVPLANALRDRIVDEGTPLLAVERGDRTLALLTLQMSYHHVAQGTLSGEPWMVAF